MKKLSADPIEGRGLLIDEVRLVGDLRVMHSKVDELYNVVANLKKRHPETSIHRYADQPVLSEDIARVDEIYLWFISLKDESKKQTFLTRRK